MVPGLDLQLRVVMKALRDVVAPAVDPANQLAQEQLGLSLATLAMVQSRLPYLHAGSRRELINAVDLAKAVVAAAETDAIDGQIAEAQTLLNDPDGRFVDLEATRSALLAAVAKIVDGTQDAALRAAVGKAVVKASKPEFDLVRAWSLPAGFEPDPSEVPPLESVL